MELKSLDNNCCIPSSRGCVLYKEHTWSLWEWIRQIKGRQGKSREGFQLHGRTSLMLLLCHAHVCVCVSVCVTSKMVKPDLNVRLVVNFYTGAVLFALLLIPWLQLRQINQAELWPVHWGPLLEYIGILGQMHSHCVKAAEDLFLLHPVFNFVAVNDCLADDLIKTECVTWLTAPLQSAPQSLPAPPLLNSGWFLKNGLTVNQKKGPLSPIIHSSLCIHTRTLWVWPNGLCHIDFESRCLQGNYVALLW